MLTQRLALARSTELVGVTTDHPHPRGYRPDLPLRSELALPSDEQDALDAAREEAREAGYESGKFNAEEDARDELSSVRRRHEQEIVEARANLEAAQALVDELRAQLAQKSA